MKLAWFSPLPPARSDIANFTTAVAGALSRLCQLTLWTDQAEVDPAVARIAPVQRFTPGDVDYALLNDADMAVFNIGNNANYHRAIFDVARTTPGVMLLHDTRLQHFFARYSETPGTDRTFYLDAMRRAHGAQAAHEAASFIAGTTGIDPLVERYPMAAAAADAGLCSIVHNAAEQRVLAWQTQTPVHVLPLAFGVGPALPPIPGDGTLRLVVFGFIGANRRLPSILEALAGLDDAFVLDIYGQLEDPASLAALVAQFGLHDRVRVHGFVDDLAGALRRADLAINLRSPTMGEASGSQLRIWDAGLPSLVTRIGWYAALPEDAVFFVEPDDEVAGIRRHVRAACRDLAAFRAAGARGRAILERHHRPEAYAAGVLRVAEEAMGLHGRRVASDLARAAARALMACAGGAGMALCAEGVGRRIGVVAGYLAERERACWGMASKGGTRNNQVHRTFPVASIQELPLHQIGSPTEVSK